MSKADDIFWREFGVVLAALVLFTVIVFFAARSIGGQSFEANQNSPQAVLERIRPFGQVRVGEPDQVTAAAAPAAAPAEATTSSGGGEQMAAAAGDGEAVYNKACGACHAAGVAGAPKLGDKAVWEARFAQGMDTLVTSAIKGKGGMPPKGGQLQLSDAEVKEAVEYMVEKAGL